MGPRDWRPADDDEPGEQWQRRDHEWSWGGRQRTTLPRWERAVRTGIQWSWVAAFVLILVLWLTR